MKQVNLRSVLFIYLLANVTAALSQTTRLRPPTRDPHTPGFVTATELADGNVPPADADGNFIIGPTHVRANEMFPIDSVPKGTIVAFTMSSADSKLYPGIAR